MSIKIYTTGCPKCKILEKKLQEKHILFTKCEDVIEMKQKGFESVPMMEINTQVPNEEVPYTQVLNFAEAVKWVNNITIIN